MANFDDVVEVAADWPGVSVGLWYGTDGLKVAGKGFCRLWSEREHRRDDVHDTEVLVVLCELDEKPALMASAAGVLFETAHYEGHGAVLVRLAEVDLEDLAGYLEESYRLKAGPKQLAAFDAD